MATGRILPGLYKTPKHKLQLGIWPWTQGLRSRLPQHFKKNYAEQFVKDPKPVHWRPVNKKYTINKFGRSKVVANVPIPVVHVAEADLGLWGGESFVFGYRKRKDMLNKPSIPYIWKPVLMKRSLYSEVLDKWMKITVTQRTLDLIDQCFGFDNYILETHAVDLQSKLGMRLKREMLIALVTKSMYPDDKEKQDNIFKKYQHFIIPLEEAEWLGLSLSQAEKKMARIEAAQAEAAARPLKQVFAEELLENYREGNIEEEKESLRSRFAALNPFK